MTQLLWYPNFVISVICLTPYLKKYKYYLKFKKKEKADDYMEKLLEKLITKINFLNV